jgi:hypothetical protein
MTGRTAAPVAIDRSSENPFTGDFDQELTEPTAPEGKRTTNEARREPDRRRGAARCAGDLSQPDYLFWCKDRARLESVRRVDDKASVLVTFMTCRKNLLDNHLCGAFLETLARGDGPGRSRAAADRPQQRFARPRDHAG